MEDISAYDRIEDLLSSTSDDEVTNKGSGGSVRRKKANIERDHEEPAQRLPRQYFSDTPRYGYTFFKGDAVFLELSLP